MNTRNAQAYIDRTPHNTGEWFIVASKGTAHYGPYSSREAARSRIGRKDSLGFSIAGTIIQKGAR